jgi:hypothetical protein
VIPATELVGWVTKDAVQIPNCYTVAGKRHKAHLRPSTVL